MIPLTLAEIAAAVGGRLDGPARTVHATGIATHSGDVRPGDLFVAMRGLQADGHAFVRDAFARGAVAALVHRAVPKALGPIIKVRHTGKALLALAAHYRHRLTAPVIVVTGSVGKTTTKELLYHALGGAGVVACSPRSLNNHVGLPLSLLAADASHRAIVLEVGGSAPGEIGRLAAAAQPRIAVMTVIGEAHLRGFGDLAGVARGKAEVLAALPRDGVAFLNGDDPVLRAIGKMHGGDVRLYGTGPFAELRGADVDRTDDGLALTCLGERFAVPFLSPVHANNLIAAIGVVHELGVPLPVAARRLRAFRPADHRLTRQRVGPFVVLDDAYNSNPVSARAGLAELAATPAPRRVAVLGEMLDLGSHAPRCHREVGEAVAAARVDACLGVGPSMRLTLAASQAPVQHHYDDTAALCAALPGLLRPGDAILVKASRAWAFERVVETIRRSVPRSGIHSAVVPAGATA